MESQPQNPEFRNNPENFHPSRIGPDKQLLVRKIVIIFEYISVNNETFEYPQHVLVENYENKFSISHSSLEVSGLQIRVHIGNYFLNFSSETYVVGTQKNRLNETVLLSTQNTCLN